MWASKRRKGSLHDLVDKLIKMIFNYGTFHGEVSADSIPIKEYRIHGYLSYSQNVANFSDQMIRFFLREYDTVASEKQTEFPENCGGIW